MHQAEYNAYIQGEWRVTPRAQVSFGARYQVQQHLKDYNNIAPTLGLSYQLNTKQNWQTVVRVGGRMNYQTYSMGNWEQLLRNGAAYQTDYLVLQPIYPVPDVETCLLLNRRRPRLPRRYVSESPTTSQDIRSSRQSAWTRACRRETD